MKSLKLRNIASACSSGSRESTPVLASLPEIAEEKTILPMTVPLGIGAHWSHASLYMLFLSATPKPPSSSGSSPPIHIMLLRVVSTLPHGTGDWAEVSAGLKESAQGSKRSEERRVGKECRSR